MRRYKFAQKYTLILVILVGVLLLFYNNRQDKHITQEIDTKNLPSLVTHKPLNKCICPETKKLLTIIVHSARPNYIKRTKIRTTWSTVNQYRNYKIETVFILGHENKTSESFKESLKIYHEQQIYNDIIIGNFIDTYRNMSYKHLTGYDWITRYCQCTDYILKTDDDIIIDIYALLNYLSNVNYSLNGYICYKAFATLPNRVDNESKWLVTKQEFPGVIYPSYCNLGAYITTVNVMRQILSVVDYNDMFWIDDVFVTGVLRKKVYKVTKNWLEIINVKEKYSWVNELKFWKHGLWFAILKDESVELMGLYWEQLVKYYSDRDTRSYRDSDSDRDIFVAN